jgi:hypothetical protein
VKTALFLVLLMSTVSAFAETQAVQEGEYPYKDLVQTAQISEEEVASMRERHEWNGPFTQEDDRLYVETVGFKGGYNMGPNSKYGIMKGMPMPAHGSGGFKWGRATARCFPLHSSTAGYALRAANIVTRPTW